MIADKFNISPMTVMHEWAYSDYLDALEYITVRSEIENRCNEVINSDS